MGSLSDYSQSRFLTIRRSLDDFGYRDSFTIDSLQLVDKLFTDLLKLTEEYKKLKIQAGHHQKIYEELEEGVGPFKEENLRLIKENSALRLDALKSKEKLDEGLQGSKSKLRNLESENADLKLLVGQFVERVKKLEIDSLVKTRKLAQFQEKNLQATINIMSDEKCQKVGVKQKMEMDYPIPNMCQYCIKVKNTVDHKPKRDPVAIDYMKIADARIEALHIQNRELKRTQDDLKNLITSMKDKIKARDEEINQFRGSNLRNYEDKKNEKGMNGFDINDSDEQNKHNKLIKILQLQLEISQRKNIQLEKTLRSSLSLGASINEKYYEPVKDLCSDFESFANYDNTHSLQAKVIQLEKQLSHCCKEKAKLKLLLEALGIAENSSMYEKLTSKFSKEPLKDQDKVDKCYVPSNSTHSSPEKRTLKGKSESSSSVPEQIVDKSSQILWKRSSKPLSLGKRIVHHTKSSASFKTKEMVEKLSSFDPKLSKRLKDDSDKKLPSSTSTGIKKQVPLSSTQSKSLEKADFQSFQHTATTQTQPEELDSNINHSSIIRSKKDKEERESSKQSAPSVEENRGIDIEFHPANIDELSLPSSDGSTDSSNESESNSEGESPVDEESFKKEKEKEQEIKNGTKLIVQKGASKTRISSPQRIQRIKPTIDYPSPNKIKQKHYLNGSSSEVTIQKSKSPFQSMSESTLQFHSKKELPSKKSEMLTSKKDFITVKTPKMTFDDEKRKLPADKSKTKLNLHQSKPKPAIFKENDDQIKPISKQSSKLKVGNQDSNQKKISITNVDDQSDDDSENLEENFDKIERIAQASKPSDRKPNLDLEKAQTQRPQTRRSKIISVVQNQDSIVSVEDQNENKSTLSSSSKPASASKSKIDSKTRYEREILGKNQEKSKNSLDSTREDQYSLQKSNSAHAEVDEDENGNEFEEKEEELSLLERMRQHKLKPSKSSKSKSHEKTHSTSTSNKGEDKLKSRSKSEDKLSAKKYSSKANDDQKKNQHKSKVSKSQDDFNKNAEKTRKRDHKTTAENLDESILVITSEESDDVNSEPEDFNNKNVTDIERYASPLDSDLRKNKTVHRKDLDKGKGEKSRTDFSKKNFKSTEEEPNILVEHHQASKILDQKQQQKEKSEEYSPTTNVNGEDKARLKIQESREKSGPADYLISERKEQNIPPSLSQSQPQQGYLEQPKIDWQRNSKILSESPYYDKYKSSPSSTTNNMDSKSTFKSSDQTKSQEYLRGPGLDRIYDQNPLDRSSLDRSRDKILAYEESSSSRYLPMVGPSPQSYYQLSQLEEENSRLKVALMDMDKDKDDIRFELDRKDEEMARLQRENVRSLEDMAKLQQRLSQAEILMGRTDTDARVNEREALVLRRQIENLREDRELLMRERDEALRELKRLQLSQSKDLSVKRSISTELEKKTKETDELKRQVQKYIDEVRRVEELLREKDEEMERLLDHFRSLTVERSNLESVKSILEKETNNFRQEARDVSDQNALLKNQLSSQADLLKAYEEEIENLTRNVVHTQAKLDSREENEKILTQEMNSAKELILKLETNLGHIRLQLSNNESSKNRLESENADLVKHLENLESSLKQEEDNRLTLEELILRNREKDYEIERNNTELLNEKEDLIDQIQRLETKVQSMSQDITSHRLKTVELQNEIDRLRRQLENERMQRESLESKLKTIQQNLHTSSANILLGSTFEESFSPLSPLSPAVQVQQQQQQQHQGQGSKMSSYTKSIETKITKIEITQPQQQQGSEPSASAVQQEILHTPTTNPPPVQINPPTDDSFDNSSNSSGSELNLGSPIDSSTGRGLERE